MWREHERGGRCASNYSNASGTEEKEKSAEKEIRTVWMLDLVRPTTGSEVRKG